MPLKIIKADEPMPVSNIVLTIYAAPGTGKTSVSQTADEPFTLDFDKGIYRAFNRRDSVTVVKWSDVAGMTAEDLAPYKTIVVDTAGRALDVLSVDIIDSNPKMGRADGSLSLQGFGALKSRFAQWQSFLRSQGKDVVLICHMDEQKNGDDTQERIDAQGSSKNEIYKSSDAMCRIRLDSKDQRFLDFDPRQGGFGKNPAQLPKIPVLPLDKNPHFLAEVIAQIKASINKQTSEQAAAVKESEDWAKAIADAGTLDAFNALLPLVKERKNLSVIQMIAKEAKERGYRANKMTGLYEGVA
jgi:AAA domain